MQLSGISKELEGQTAVVTGASRGIGRAIAMELASAGAAVLIHCRHSPEAAEATAAEIGALGSRSTIVLADLADLAEHRVLFDRAWKWRGGVDIWINNAGADILTGSGASCSFDEKLDQLWRVDVLATVHLARMAGTRMKQAGHGAIVNIGWDGAQRGMPGDSGELFATAKGAIMAFTRSLAQSLAPQVRVNCVAPGWIKTAWGDQASAAWQERAVHECLLRRWGAPEDVARAVRFLAGPGAAFINGQVVPVNGGFAIGS